MEERPKTDLLWGKPPDPASPSAPLLYFRGGEVPDVERPFLRGAPRRDHRRHRWVRGKRRTAASLHPLRPSRPNQSPPSPVHLRGDRTAEGEVGPAGGSLSLTNGARLEIPEDALDEEVVIAFSVTSATQAYANRDDIQLVGPSVMAIPPLNAADGAQFTVSVPIPNLPRDLPDEAVQLAVEMTDAHQRVGSSATTQTHWELHPSYRVRTTGKRGCACPSGPTVPIRSRKVTTIVIPSLEATVA